MLRPNKTITEILNEDSDTNLEVCGLLGEESSDSEREPNTRIVTGLSQSNYYSKNQYK